MNGGLNKGLEDFTTEVKPLSLDGVSSVGDLPIFGYFVDGNVEIELEMRDRLTK
jgi:hypothetical protein